MRSGWHVHKGKRYLYADYSNLGRDVERLEAEVNAADAIVCQEPADSVLVLTDVRGSVASNEAMAVLKKSAARTRKHIRKIAVVGVESGIRKMLMEAVSRFSGQNLVAIEDIEKAKDWLVER